MTRTTLRRCTATLNFVRDTDFHQELCSGNRLYAFTCERYGTPTMEHLVVKLDAFRNEPRSRYAAAFAVLVVHALLILIALQARRSSFDREALEDLAMVWLRIDPPLETQRAEERPREQIEPQPSARETQAQREEPVQQSTPQVSSSPPSRQIDWRSNAARSAEKIVGTGTEQGYRSFGPRKEREPGQPEAPSVFGEPPKHKYGDLGTDANDDPVVWMNDNCYTTLDKHVQTAVDWAIAGPGNFAPPSIKCLGTLGSKQANGKLFEHIRKREEPPVPKAGTEMNELPERK